MTAAPSSSTSATDVPRPGRGRAAAGRTAGRVRSRQRLLPFGGPAPVLLVGAAALVVLGAGLATAAGVAGAMADGSWDPGGNRFLPVDPTAATLAGVPFAALLVGLAGVLVGAGTRGHPAGGAAPAGWAAPARFAVAALGLMAAASLAAFLGGRAFFTTAGVEVAFSDGPSDSPAVLRAVVLGAPVYLAVVGVLGVAAGMLVRSRAAATGLLYAVVLVLGPVLALLLPEALGGAVVPYLPSAAGEAFRSVAPRPDLLAPWRGFTLLCVYLAGTAAGTTWMLRHRGR